MDNIKFNSFQNMCRTCMYTSDLKFIQDNKIIDVLQFLSGSRYSKNDELPQKLCLKCLETMNEIQSFAFECQQTHSKLTTSQNDFQNNQNSLLDNETINTNNIIEFPAIKQEIIDDINKHVTDELFEQNTIQTQLISKNNPIEISNIQEVPNKNDTNNLELLTEHFVKEELLFEQSVAKQEIKNEVIQENTFINKNNCHLRHKCEICMKSFKRPYQLVEHKRMHSGERPYQCEVCNKSFSIKSVLLKHKMIHSDERRFECETCMKGFKQLAHLIVHKRIHTGERPYQCEVCKKSFTSKSNFVAHKATHNMMLRFECDVCLKTLKNLQCLKQHKLLHKNRYKS